MRKLQKCRKYAERRTPKARKKMASEDNMQNTGYTMRRRFRRHSIHKRNEIQDRHASPQKPNEN